MHKINPEKESSTTRTDCSSYSTRTTVKMKKSKNCWDQVFAECTIPFIVEAECRKENKPTKELM